MNLYESICDGMNLLSAWEEVRTAGRAGGIDGVSLAEVESNQGKFLGDLQWQLEDRRSRSRWTSRRSETILKVPFQEPHQ